MPTSGSATDHDDIPVALAAPPGSTLAALVADYYRLHAEVAELEKKNAHLTEIKEALRREARLAAPPNAWKIDVWVPGAARPVKVRGGPYSKFMRSLFDQAYPGLYGTFSVQKERWEVRS